MRGSCSAERDIALDTASGGHSMCAELPPRHFLEEGSRVAHHANALVVGLSGRKQVSRVRRNRRHLSNAERLVPMHVDSFTFRGATPMIDDVVASEHSWLFKPAEARSRNLKEEISEVDQRFTVVGHLEIKQPADFAVLPHDI